jgi:hypothetical protein
MARLVKSRTLARWCVKEIVLELGSSSLDGLCDSLSMEADLAEG